LPNPKFLTKLTDISLLFGFFLTPLLFFTQAHDQFELPKITFLTLLAVPLLVLELREKNFKKSGILSALTLVFFASQLVACLPTVSLSWITSIWGDYENFAGLSTLLTYLVWYFILIRILNHQRIEKVFYVISLTAFFSSLYAIAQHFQLDFIQWNPESVNATREFAALGNPNFLSAYIAMSIPLFLTLSFDQLEDAKTVKPVFTPLYSLLLLLGLGFLFLATAQGQIFFHLDPSMNFSFVTRTIGLFCFSLFCIHAGRLQLLPVKIIVISVLILGLLSTASRGGFLGAFLGVLLWCFLALRNQEWKEKLRRQWILGSKVNRLVSSGVIALFLGIFGWSFIQRLFNSLLHVYQSLALSRLSIWGPAVVMMKAHPFFGVGMDTFKIAFPYYSGIQFNQIDGLFTSSRMAHNELLQIAATSGLLGLTTYLLMAGAFAFSGWKACQKVSSRDRLILIAILSSGLAYQIQNLFSFGVAALNFVWFFLLAVVAYFHQRLKNTETSSKPSFISFCFHKLIIVALLLLICLFPLRRLAADIAFGRGDVYSSAIKNPDPQTSSDALIYYSDTEINYNRRAADLFPWDLKYSLYLGQSYEQRAGLDHLRAQDWYQNALFFYQKVSLMSPANAYYYNDQGRVYTALSGYDRQYDAKAEQAYAQAVHFSPSSPYFILNWMTSLEKVGNTAEAQEQVQKAFEIDPTFTAKILAQMAFESYKDGDKTTAFRYVNEAAEGNTLSAEAFYCRGILYLSEKEKKKALADFLYVKSLPLDPYKDNSIQHLDDLIQESGK
jgi:O-antigen ligase